jgi:hypothetical protein
VYVRGVTPDEHSTEVSRKSGAACVLKMLLPMSAHLLLLLYPHTPAAGAAAAVVVVVVVVAYR